MEFKDIIKNIVQTFEKRRKKVLSKRLSWNYYTVWNINKIHENIDLLYPKLN